MTENQLKGAVPEKKHHYARKIFKTVILTIMGLVLFPVAVVMGVYSPWLQDCMRERLVERMNQSPSVQMRIGEMRLKFPFDLTMSDVLMVEHGDTIIEAGMLDAKVSLRTILDGKIELKEANLSNARYQIGAMDSASCLVIRGKDVKVDRSTVVLSPMDIHVTKMTLDSAKVSMYINPIDTFVSPESEPSPLKIRVDEIDYKNLTYEMQLMPVIYQLSTTIKNGSVNGVAVDVMGQTVEVNSFAGNGMSASYIMPDSTQIANTKVIVNENIRASSPWTVKVHDIDLKDSQALYATYGIKPVPGLDFEYIEASDVNLHIKDFYNKATDVKIPLSIQGTERCGVNLDASGTIDIDSVGLAINDFTLKTTSGTDLKADGYMGTQLTIDDPNEPLRLTTSGILSVADVNMMFPDFSPYFAGLREGADIDYDILLKGVSSNLDISKFELFIDHHIKLAASGNVKNVFEPEKLSGSIFLDGTVTDISNWTDDFLKDSGITIPALTIKGDASFGDEIYAANLTMHTKTGILALKGAFNGHIDNYDLDLKANSLSVDAIYPELGIGSITTTVKAHGTGFDFLKPQTVADVDVDLTKIEYHKKTFKDIQLKAKVGNDHASVYLNSKNPGLDLHLDANGVIENRHYIWDIDLDSRDVDLAELGLSDTPAVISADANLKADITLNLKDIIATLDLNKLEYKTSDANFSLDNSKLILSTTDTLTNLTAQNRDLYAFYSSPLPLDSIMGRVDKVSRILDSQYSHHEIDIPQLQKAIMPFTLDIEGGNDNAVAQMLAENNINFNKISVLASNDSSLYFNTKVLNFSFNEIKLDSIDFNIKQVGPQLNYIATVNNKPGTMDEWAHIDLSGYFKTGKLGINLEQKNIKNQVGFDLGATLSLNADSTMTLHFEPYTPTINYRKWDVNNDNFINFDFRHYHLDADLKMKSDVSTIALYTEHAKSTDKELHGADEDLILQLFDIQLQDWIALDPFAPPIKGNLSAGIRLNWEDMSLNGNGTVDLTDFTYGKERVGDFSADIGLETDTKGKIKTEIDLWVNNQKTVVLNGVLNDSTKTSPFNLDFEMIHFPLTVANPFISDMAKLSGSLNGKMDIQGNANAPVLNGYLAFEDANIDVDMIGSTFVMTSDTIPVKDNIIKFNKFHIFGANENPLDINGTVDMTSIVSPNIAVDLNADNMQIVNSVKARRGADVYGKAFIGLKSTVRGNLDYLNVNANVSVLPGTNVTYILAGGATALETQTAGDMVKFVNFADTAAVAAADSLKLEGMVLNLTANLDILTGTIINVDLGTNAQDRVQLQGTGNFTYISSPIGSGRLTGRYTFNGGFFKYAPPLISNLNFAFTEGSYVAFSGDIMNPQFNIKAIERMKANVSQAGQNSRLIYFDIILSVIGSLDSFKPSFNLETDDDVTVANELASMSPTQRESEAINLLLYNTYTGGSTKATSNLNGNPLFSFLTNSVNSWLANNVHGIDLSIGVDQYDQTTNGSTSTTTSYSYRVSKSLFNDRFKIVVGGSYSDDANDDNNVAENLINDISFEYYLNNARTMYVKLFRHTGFESILEGEITQTGVGFVYKKRISRLSDMLWPIKRKDNIESVDKAPLEENHEEEKQEENKQNDVQSPVIPKDETTDATE